MEKSLIEYAYESVVEAKDSLSFSAIWAYVKEKANLSDEEASKKIGQFYTNLLLDGRFVTLGENNWDLRERHTFDKVHIDMKDVYSDVDTNDDDAEEGAEQKEYNEVFEEKDEDRDDEIQPEEGEDEESQPTDERY